MITLWSLQVLIAGSPCADWSRAGNQAGLDGPTSACTLAWLKVAPQAMLVIHENVPQFPRLLEHWLAETHNVHHIKAVRGRC